MLWWSDPGAWLGRIIFERGVALLLLITLISTIRQFRALLSSTGLLPIPRFLELTRPRDRPSIFGLYYSDRFFLGTCWFGVVLCLVTIAGGTAALPWWAHALAWAAMWAIYLSIINVGQRWYSFLWEMLLCEVLFLGIFIGPADRTPSLVVTAALIWLLIRVEFGAGMIKMRGGREWRDLTALDYHHETQPMPGPLSWYFHHLPKIAHRVETGANHVVQLVVPFALLAPDPVRSIAALVIAATQAYLVLSGNFAWVNLLTICLALSLVDASFLRVVLPLREPAMSDGSVAEQWILVAFGLLSIVLAWQPLRNLLSSQQKMNARYNPFYLGNSYGAFGTIGKVRREIVISGSAGRDQPWREYEFPGKPGDLARRPPQVAPYHQRLGWMLWFAALSPAYGRGWLDRLIKALLTGDRDIKDQLRVDPFPDEPPAWVKVTSYDYRFSTPAERRATGDWWVRTNEREYLAPRRLR